MRLYALLTAALMLPAAALAELRVHDAWMGAVPPTSRVGAVYLVLENTGPGVVVLGAAASTSAPRIELHQSIHSEGRVRMQEQPSIELAPGEELDFSASGHHYMLFFDGQPVPAPGEHVGLRVEVEGAEQALEISAEVRRRGAGDGREHAEHDHSQHDHGGSAHDGH